MKTLKTLAVVALVSLTMSCQKDELPTTSEGVNIETPRLNLFSVYVMDARFSRTTCWTGPGVCFKDGFGNVWDYNFFDNQINNPDVGPIGVTLSGENLNLGFYRSLEEKEFILESDVVLTSSLANALGKKRIIMKAGAYPLSHTRLRNGEASVKIISE